MATDTDRETHTGRVGADESPPDRFKKVVDKEWEEINRRRMNWGIAASAAPEPKATGIAADAPDPAPSNLVGLALSGGGIRSATFNLGLLQELSRLRVLRMVDYLSTVSGGGFAGGWWSAWLSRDDRPDGSPRFFPPPERVEPQRWGSYLDAEGQAMPDASLSASENDPVHHLRLFANYLTPRRGFLSADTWRAGSIVTRNLLLTWLVLLPLLLGVVVASQIYFTLDSHPRDHFLREFPARIAAAPVAARTSPPAAAVADRAPVRTQKDRVTLAAVEASRGARLSEMGYRVRVMLRPLAILVTWAVMLTLLWMLYGPGSGRVQLGLTTTGTLVAIAVGYALYRAFDNPGGDWIDLRPQDIYVALVGGIVLLVVFRLVPLRLLLLRRSDEAVRRDQTALLRNRVDRAHSLVLVAFFVTAAVLLVAGFSHDLLWYLFDPNSGGPVPGWIKRAGGVGSVLATLGAMLFTGIRGAPTSVDAEAKSQPGLKSRIVFAATPALAVLLLSVSAAALSRALIRRLGEVQDVARIDLALVLSVGLFLIFASYEMVGHDGRLKRWRQWLVVILAVAAAGLTLWLAPSVDSLTLRGAALAVALAGFCVVQGWTDARVRSTAAAGSEEAMNHQALLWGISFAIAALVPFILLVLVLPETGGVPRGALQPAAAGTGPRWIDGLILAGVAFCGAFALAEHLLARCQRRRGLALATAAFVALSLRLLLPFIPIERTALVYSAAAITLAVFAFAWVVGLGWMADPNLVSLHAFYKGRLVRAYMGASNRKRNSEEITESCMGDDLPVHAMRNCERGAPYHLLNATLNLVGGRDLSTQQRSADYFVFTRHHCGSTRTGWRPTEQYMGGKLTLGTAVAVSGAAASPNMGSRTPSAAVAMLLSFLNVRLAFWAPTPNQARWREAQPRLWPFYLIRESLSQTNDLSAYCCLSDGGHFDNTGLYSLVARGCRYIILSDCGADPKPCFEDLGNAIRRCRIDFGAEIDLSIDPFTRKQGAAGATHFAVGSIRYAKPHARALGWRDWKDEDGRSGVLVWVRPALLQGRDPADVRQYGLENEIFPQQTTADQWFDEAQFESYRRLGEESARQAFPELGFPTSLDPVAVRAYFDNLLKPAVSLKPHFRIDFVEIDGKRAFQVVEDAST